METLQQEIMTSIKSDNFEYFKEIVQNSSGLWKAMKSLSGNTLLQELIQLKKPQFFRYLLAISDTNYLETRNFTGQTAITLALDVDRWYRLRPLYEYIPELISKYDVLPSHYDDGNLLTWCVEFMPYYFDLNRGNYRSDAQLPESLLRKGMNPNARFTEDGPTPLHTALKSYRCSEFIFLLLLCGADPFLTLYSCNAFELSVFLHSSSSVCQLLFDYTLDHLQTYQLNFLVLLELANDRSPLFDRIIEYDVKFAVNDLPIENCYCTRNVDIILNLETCYLKILLKKYFHQIRDSFRYDVPVICVRTPKIDDKLLERISLIAESGATTVERIVYIFGSEYIFPKIVELEETAAGQIITFLCQYGLEMSREVFDLVYRSFGYCDLFRFLLHIEYIEKPSHYHRLLIVSLYCDIHLDLDEVLKEQTRIYSEEKLEEVLGFFAHWKVRRFLLRKVRNENEFGRKIKECLKHHPKVASLLELSRDAFRKSLVQRYQIDSAKRFYSLLAKFDLNLVYKQIICLEKKIYNC